MRPRVGGDQPRPPPAAVPQAAGSSFVPRTPEQWSEEEAFFRTGSMSVMDSDEWVATELGGSDIKRRLNNYLADNHSVGQRGPACNKTQNRTCKLVPGCMVFWCTKCRKCKVMCHICPSYPYRCYRCHAEAAWLSTL